MLSSPCIIHACINICMYTYVSTNRHTHVPNGAPLSLRYIYTYIHTYLHTCVYVCMSLHMQLQREPPKKHLYQCRKQLSSKIPTQNLYLSYEKQLRGEVPHKICMYVRKTTKRESPLQNLHLRTKNN